VFPAPKVALDPADGKVRRYHVYEKTLQAAVRRAARRARIPKHAPRHTPRQSFATRLLLSGLEDLLHRVFDGSATGLMLNLLERRGL
jgi:hypothetical protein